MKLPKSLLIVLILLGYVVALLLIYLWINRPSYYEAYPFIAIPANFTVYPATYFGSKADITLSASSSAYTRE
jgi:hypothetical protein